MVKIESKEVTLNCSAEECFNFLSDMNNYEQILPEKDITDWEGSKERCLFKIKKTYTLELLFDSSEPNSKIHINSGPSCPLKFTLDMEITDLNESCKAQLICDADINQFLKVIIEKPLYYLFNYMADRLETFKG